MKRYEMNEITLPEKSTPSFKLFGRDFKVDPYPTYAAMRASAPIYRRSLRNRAGEDGAAQYGAAQYSVAPHDAGHDRGICFVTRYDDVAAMLRDTQHFVKNIHNSMTTAERACAPQPPPLLRLVANHMLNQDAPEHTRLRSLVNRTFTVPMIERLEPQIIGTAHELIGRFAHRLRTGETVDLIHHFALPLPIIVIAELLGIPSRERNRFRAWSNAIVSPTGDVQRMDRKLEKSGPLIRDFVQYLREVFAARRSAPSADLISSLLHENTGEGGPLHDEELFSMLLLLIVVGHETTVNLIGNGVLALLQTGQCWQQLGADPARIPAAVEESLRYDCPVERAPMRFAAADLKWHGIHIRRGDHISLVLGSANRDETKFADADTFRLDRIENRHLAFGLGPHYCLGAPLARLEGRIALETLVAEFPTLTLAVASETLRRRPHPIMRGLTRLPVRLA